MADGTRVHVDAEYVTESMMEPNEQIVAGFAPVMPTYQGRIAPAETAAIVDLLRSLSRATREEDLRGRRD
jgi:cytochrome c oxidase subunit 2